MDCHKTRYCGNAYSIKYDNKQPITEDYLTNLNVPVSKSIANIKQVDILKHTVEYIQFKSVYQHLL